MRLRKCWTHSVILRDLQLHGCCVIPKHFHFLIIPPSWLWNMWDFYIPVVWYHRVDCGICEIFIYQWLRKYKYACASVRAFVLCTLQYIVPVPRWRRSTNQRQMCCLRTVVHTSWSRRSACLHVGRTCAKGAVTCWKSVSNKEVQCLWTGCEAGL